MPEERELYLGIDPGASGDLAVLDRGIASTRFLACCYFFNIAWF